VPRGSKAILEAATRCGPVRQRTDIDDAILRDGFERSAVRAAERLASIDARRVIRKPFRDSSEHL